MCVCVCVLEIDFVWLDGALLCAGCKCLLLLLCVLRAVRVCVCAVVSRVACWIELGARAAWFMCLSVASVVALRGVVWVVHDGRGDGTQKMACGVGVLRFCVALRCENRNG